MAVEVVAPGDDVVVEIGETVDDRHAGTVLTCGATIDRCAGAGEAVGSGGARQSAALLDEGDTRVEALAGLHVGEDEGPRARASSCASRSITSSEAPTIGARSILLMTSRSERVMPGPPFRGILSPAETSMT